MIRRLRQQLVVSMFNLRRVLCSVEGFYLLLVLLSSILVTVTCKPSSVIEGPNVFEFDACGSYKSSFEPSPDQFGGHIYKHTLENVCQYSSSFCFPSTVPAFSDKEIDAELASPDTNEFRSETISYGLEKMRNSLSLSPGRGNLKFIYDQNISCSLFQKDDYLGFLSSFGDSNNGEHFGISCCLSNLLGKKSHVLRSGYVVETVVLNDSFKPLVEIKPSSLDWGRRMIYELSNVFLTVRNIDSDSVLSVYDIYSSNSQFYSCNFSKSVLAPGEVVSICFAFSPTELGLSSGQLVLHTSIGGFLIQAKGVTVESPYLVKPLGGFDVSSNGRWRKNLSLYNPFNEVLYVEEVAVWIFTYSGNVTQASISICNISSAEDFNKYSTFNRNDWFGVGIGESNQQQIALKPHKNWEITPRDSETIIELDIPDHFEGKFSAAFGLRLCRSSDNEIFSLIIPLEAEFNHSTALGTGRRVSVSLEALVPCSISGLVFIALSIMNNAPHVLSLVKVIEESDGVKTFGIKSKEGLILFPGTTTQVAVLNYASVGIHEITMNCKLLVLINDTRNPRIEVPCTDVFNVCSRSAIDISFGFAEGIRNVNYIDDGQRYIIISSEQRASEIKVADGSEADEAILYNWKSQGTESGSFITVLDEKELLFPMVLLGNYSSKWISVKNPSPKPVVMQLILNSAEIIDNCRTPDVPLHHLSSIILVGNTSIAPTRYGFSIGKDALTETYIHPYGSANLGPILFQPSYRCEWRSSALIRNNASGVEWLALRGFGGSLSLELLEGYDPVQILEFKLNLPTWINASSLDNLNSLRGQNHSCLQPLTKEVYVKNTGELPLEVIKIKVSGSECDLDGFKVHNCKGFSLLPGESKGLHITYHTEFSTATIQRDLELVLATGVVVMPMKVSIPICLINFCKRSLFWMRIRKAIFGILLAAFLLYLLVFLLFPRVTGSTFEGFRSGRYLSSSLISRLSSLHMCLNMKKGQIKSMFREETLLIDPANGCPDNLSSKQGHEHSPIIHEKQITSSDSQPEHKLMSRSSSYENIDMLDSSDSQDLRVRVGNDKRRRRRKKKASGPRVSSLFEVSSSQSSNSTPSSPISPISSTTHKRRPRLVSPQTVQPVEVKNPFSQVPYDKNKQPKHSLDINLSDNDCSSKHSSKKQGTFTQENSSVVRKVAGRAVLLPSATFPSSSRTMPVWTSHSPFLASPSPIAPRARAPGTELHNKKYGRVEDDNMASDEKKYIYDIWGNHLFENVLLTYHQSRKISGMSTPPVIENNSESFFERGPQTLVKKALMESLTSREEDNDE